MKKNKIYGGIYKGKYWRDFADNNTAKKIAHKQARKAAKVELYNA